VTWADFCLSGVLPVSAKIWVNAKWSGSSGPSQAGVTSAQVEAFARARAPTTRAVRGPRVVPARVARSLRAASQRHGITMNNSATYYQGATIPGQKSAARLTASERLAKKLRSP
jgi:hypothetical protein